MLYNGLRGDDVRYLQVILNVDEETRLREEGPGAPGNETDYFGTLTARSVERFKERHVPEAENARGVVGKPMLEELNDILEVD